jgi:Protein of unknown function (DUF3617)
MGATMKLKFAVFAVIAMCGTNAALAQSLPKMKAGMWESTMTQPGVEAKKDAKGEPMKSTMCLNDAVMEQMMKMGQGISQQMCSKNTSQVSGNKMTGSAECKMGGSTITSNTVTTFNGDSSYRTEAKAVYNPPLYGMKETVTVTEAKYVGPCKSGMKPGDVSTMGVTMNILDMSKGMSANK